MEIPRTQTKLMNGQIQVAGDQWPVFLYADYRYDSEDPWNGLLRGGVLISVNPIILHSCYYLIVMSGVPTHFHLS